MQPPGFSPYTDRYAKKLTGAILAVMAILRVRLQHALIPVMAVLALITGCSGASTSSTPAAPKPDFLAANMDRAVNPGEDVFTFANGAWLKAHPIPASESGWGIGNVVREELYVNLRKINEDAANKGGASGTDEQKIGDFWTPA